MVSHHIFVFPFLVPLTKKGEILAIWGSTRLVLPLLFFPLGQKLFIAAAQKERKLAGKELTSVENIIHFTKHFHCLSSL